MAKRSTSNDKVLVDPLFLVPEGAEDEFVYSREGTDTEEVVTDDFLEEGFEEQDYVDVVDFEDVTDEGEQVFIATPETFAIIDQKLRSAPGGQQVVDIVIDCEDVPGAVRYEIQVTKI